MAEHEVRRLPVVEEDGKLVGIVAQADVARHAFTAAPAKSSSRFPTKEHRRVDFTLPRTSSS